jgi:hypothetical protein
MAFISFSLTVNLEVIPGAALSAGARDLGVFVELWGEGWRGGGVEVGVGGDVLPGVGAGLNWRKWRTVWRASSSVVKFFALFASLRFDS